jgi:hypothetical protein
MTETEPQPIGTDYTVIPSKPLPCTGGCEQKIANLTAAVIRLTAIAEDTARAVNDIGNCVTVLSADFANIVRGVAEFQTRMSAMSPMQMVKQMMAGGK